LPVRARQGRPDGLDQAAMRVAGGELYAGNATRDQVEEERQPVGAAPGAGDLQTEDRPFPPRSRRARAARAPSPSGQPPGDLSTRAPAATKAWGPTSSGRARHVAACPSGCLAISPTWLFDSRSMPNVATSRSICRVETEQVAGRDDRDQPRLGPAAPLWQSVGKGAALARLGIATSIVPTRVSQPPPEAVAGVHPLLAPLAVAGGRRSRPRAV
jgi:hypothetical protein